MTIFKDVVELLRAFGKAHGSANPPASLPIGELSRSAPIRGSSEGEDVVSRISLPPEIWRVIIAFAIRLNGRNAIRLDNPFLPIESSSVDEPGMRQDRATLPLVCRSWRAMTSQIIPEYLMICSIPQLRAIVDKFEECRDGSLLFQGEWVQRIDFQIPEPLTNSPDLIPRLLRRTPNLVIYVNKMGSDYRPETQTPPAVLEALAKYCGPSLRRIEWSYPGEAPAWYDLANLCYHAPNLCTLRLTWIFSYQKSFPKPLELPLLETISLGLIPDPVDSIVQLPRTWDPLLINLAAHPETLPALNRVELDLFPTDLTFFHAHGAKIRMFRTTNWTVPPMLPHALPLLPNLESLILTQSTEYVTLPPAHPTLRRICIAPLMENDIEVPPRMFATAVLVPLESVLLSIDSTKLPRLEEVRLRNRGILVHVLDEPAWLQKWAKRWQFRGVRFCDLQGRSFDEVADPDNDSLLNAVRG